MEECLCMHRLSRWSGVGCVQGHGRQECLCMHKLSRWSGVGCVQGHGGQIVDRSVYKRSLKL